MEIRYQKISFLGSSCIYPKFAQQPIKEEYLLNNCLEPTTLSPPQYMLENEEKKTALYEENYDPKKNHPEFSGVAKIESTQIKTFIEYLTKATPDFDEYSKSEYVPVQADGWMNKSEKGFP